MSVLNQIRLFAVVVVVVCLSIGVFALCIAEEPADLDIAKSMGSLQLVNGDIYRGEVSPMKSDRPDGALLWRCPSFVSDLVVPWSALERITQPIGNAVKHLDSGVQDGSFVVEMQNGESVTGDIVDMNDTSIEFEGPRIGKKRFPLESIRSILRTSPTSVSEEGVVAASNWKQTIPPIKKDGRSKWFAKLGSYETETAGTAITQSISMPDLAAIDIGVAWEQSSPNWMLTIGEPRRLELHVRKLETRNVISLTLLVEDESSADIASAQIPSDGLTSLSLRILSDSNRGRLVLVHGNNPIAQIRINKGMRLTGRQAATFTNIAAGRVALRELKIYRSIFASPSMKISEKDKAKGPPVLSTETLLRTGETFVGMPTAFDAATKSFAFSNSSDKLGRVTLDQVDRIEFPAVEKSADTLEARLYALETWSGARYVGNDIQFQELEFVLKSTQLESAIRIPIDEVKSVGTQGAQAKQETAKEASDSKPNMRLLTPWVISLGNIDRVSPLENGGTEPSSQAFVFWKPIAALNAIPIAATTTGNIEPVPVITKASAAARVATTNTKRPESSMGRLIQADEPSLFLKSGDCFPAIIETLDEVELRFNSKEFQSARIPVEFIRGIRIAVSQTAETLEKGARKRLMTLPRSQRNNPPKHLIVSREGDAIRGILKSMTTDVATFEVRGEDRTLYTKNMAELVWLLDAPEIVPIGKKPSVVSQEPQKQELPQRGDAAHELRCQALYASGTRITIIPERFEDGILFGRHPQLGKCQLEISKVSRFVLGDEIATEAQKNRFGKWKLENAPDPKFVNDLDEEQDPGDPNTSHSRMIGKEAPDFELSKLDGATLRLSDLKGRIVVLDFWATWCGPCVASLPKMVELSQEYKGAEVDLVTVNIEQKPAEIQAMLDRLEIKPTVVMDIDGSVARAFEAEAIPQTVIIDRKGNVSFVIVGGGEATEKKVRGALDSILDLKQ